VAHPVILAIWEAEIMRIEVRGQPWKIIFETLISKITSKMEWRYGLSGRAPALQL
jgi:hypothetical protein